MSQDQESHILTDKSGIEWNIRPTDQGLLIEANDRTLLRLTQEGVFIRGNLSVDGQINREFDCHKFVGEWKVLPNGSVSLPDPDYMILRLKGNIFELFSRPGLNGKEEFEQALRFNVRTGSLESLDEGPGPDRSISFWDRKSHTWGAQQANRIFGMRRERAGQKNNYLPWEIDPKTGQVFDDNGTWGAEEG